MSGIAFSSSVQDAPVARALGRLLSAGADMAALMDEIGGLMVDETVEHFVEEKGPDGSPWPASIRARVMGGQTLTDRGHLRDSITHEATADSVRWGSVLLYAPVHQRGATITAKQAKALRFTLPGAGLVQAKSVTIPARPFLGYSDENQAAVRDIVLDWLHQSWEGAP